MKLFWERAGRSMRIRRLSLQDPNDETQFLPFRRQRERTVRINTMSAHGILEAGQHWERLQGIYPRSQVKGMVDIAQLGEAWRGAGADARTRARSTRSWGRREVPWQLTQGTQCLSEVTCQAPWGLTSTSG